MTREGKLFGRLGITYLLTVGMLGIGMLCFIGGVLAASGHEYLITVGSCVFFASAMLLMFGLVVKDIKSKLTGVEQALVFLLSAIYLVISIKMVPYLLLIIEG